MSSHSALDVLRRMHFTTDASLIMMMTIILTQIHQWSCVCAIAKILNDTWPMHYFIVSVVMNNVALPHSDAH